jgi:hypothetical protein
LPERSSHVCAVGLLHGSPVLSVQREELLY